MGTAGGVRNVRDHFERRDVPGHLRRRAHRHRPDRASDKRHQEDGGIATLALKRVDDPSELGVVIVDEDGRIQGFQEKPDAGRGAVQPRQLRHLRVRAGDLRLLPRPEFVDWAQDVFPALLEQDVAFYGHEIYDYWNDVGSMRGVPAGQLRRARGGVRRSEHGRRCDAAARAARADAEVEGPVFIGEGCTIAAGVRLTGPVVIGERLPIGEGSRCATRSCGREPSCRSRHGADRRRRRASARWPRSSG